MWLPIEPDDLTPFEMFKVNRAAARAASARYHLPVLQQIINAAIALAGRPVLPPSSTATSSTWAPGSIDGRILGTYVHGLFDEPAALDALLRWAGLDSPRPLDLRACREGAIERLADAIEQHLDLAAIGALLELELAKIPAQRNPRGDR